MFRRSVAALIIFFIVSALLIGCGSAPKEDEPETTDDAAAEGASMQTTEDPAKIRHAEKLSFTVASLDYPDGFNEYPLVLETKELFNMDFKVSQVPLNIWGETMRTQAATNTLPEVVTCYDLKLSEYKKWVEQGVFIPFPTDMSPWPHLKNNLDQLAVTQHLIIGGNLYCSPKTDKSLPDSRFNNDVTIIRRDWANALGYDWDFTQTVTLDDYIKFLRDVKEKDPGDVGVNIIPCDPEGSGQGWIDMLRWWNCDISEYVKNGDGIYEWGARSPTSLIGIKILNSMYKEGLLYSDGYADFAAEKRFSTGRTASHYSAMTVQKLTGIADSLAAAVPRFSDEDLGAVIIQMPGGKSSQRQVEQYRTAFAFSNNCSNKIMERWLDVGDWLLEAEQLEKYAYGVPDKDWKKDAGGNVTVNWKADEIIPGAPKYYITGQRALQQFFVLEGADLWLAGNPSLRSILRNNIFLDFYRRIELDDSFGGVAFYPVDYDIQFIDGPNKDQYGAFGSPIRDVVMQAVRSDNPEAVWNDFLEAAAPLVESVLAEINA